MTESKELDNLAGKQQAQNEEAATPAAPKTILVLSEEGSIRSAIQDALKENNYDVRISSHSLEALKILKKISVDVLIIDVIFSDGGFEDFVSLAENVSVNNSPGIIFLIQDYRDTLATEHQTHLRNFCLPRAKLKKDILVQTVRQIIDPDYSPEKEANKLEGRILVVEPDMAKRHSIVTCLKDAGLETLQATDNAMALKVAREKLPEVMMINAALPDCGGIECLTAVKKDPALSGIPVLILCDEANLITIRTAAFTNGALGCVSYPINVHEVLAQVGVMVELTQTHAKIQEHAVSLAVANFELEETRQLLEQKKRELERSNEHKSEFLAKMSHELRTPLTAMMGFAQKALHSFSDQDECKDSIRTILRNGEHLLDLINDILDLSKIEAGKLAIDLRSSSPIEILEDVRALMSIRAEQKGLNFWIEYVTSLPEVIISDPMRLKQILLNLVGNSIKFTHKGSVKIAVGCDRDSESMTFQIVDTGIGIAEDKRNQLFQAFVQGDTEVTRKFGGTGLGLTISLQLAELLGGSITVDSILGMGSSFRVTIKTGPLKNVKFLTLVDLQSLRQIGNDSEEIRIEQLSGRVLIAEDNNDNQKLLDFYFKKSGATFLIVSNGQDALQYALDEEFDVVLLDMQMPVMDGYTAARKLRDRGYVKPVIGLTANNLDSEIRRALDAGCDKVLCKPYDWTALFLQLKEYIGTKNEEPIVIGAESEMADENASHAQGAQGEKGAVLSQIYDNNVDFQPLIIEFLEGLDQYIRSLEFNLKSRNWNDLKAVAHDISGVAGMYGYLQCSEEAKKLRLSSMQKDYKIATACTEKLIEHLNRMKLGLAIYKQEAKQDLTASATETEVITSELFKLSPELAPHIIEFLDNIETVLLQIQAATKTQDWNTLAAITNEVSGTASLYGYPSFAAVAKELEEAVEAGNTGRVEKLLNKLDSMKDAMIRGRNQVS